MAFYSVGFTDFRSELSVPNVTGKFIYLLETNIVKQYLSVVNYLKDI